MMAGCVVGGRDPVGALTPAQSSGWDTGAKKMVEPESAATSAAAADISGDPAAGRAAWWPPNSGSGKHLVWLRRSAMCHLHVVRWEYCSPCGQPPLSVERLCVRLG